MTQCIEINLWRWMSKESKFFFIINKFLKILFMTFYWKLLFAEKKKHINIQCSFYLCTLLNLNVCTFLSKFVNILDKEEKVFKKRGAVISLFLPILLFLYFSYLRKNAMECIYYTRGRGYCGYCRKGEILNVRSKLFA